MTNETIFLITTLGVFSLIRYFSYKGRRWLHACVVVNLILITVFGAKLIPIFGVVTNVGNIFYAMVFLCGQILTEHYGRDEGRRAVRIGLLFVIYFVIMGQLVVAYTSAADSGASAAIATLFKFAPRISIASLLAYLFAQTFNVEIYSFLRTVAPQKIWLRSIIATTAGQAVDSAIFFTVAFWGTVTFPTFEETMLVGFIFKTMLGAVSIPFLYLSSVARTKKEVLEEEAAAILNSIGECLIITDKKGEILAVNKEFEDTLGWKNDEVLGRPFADVLKSFDDEGNPVPFKERILVRVLSGEKMQSHAINHTFFERRDGSKFPSKITVTPILIDHSIVGAVQVFRDITKEKEIERMRADFLSLASHQLRTPLSGTKWVIETLQKEIVGTLNARQKEYLKELYGVNSRLIELVADLLRVVRFEEGNVVVAHEPFSAAKVLEETVAMMHPAAKERNITLAIAGDSRVVSDQKLVKSIIETFISNAISYAHPHTKVEIKIVDDKEETVFAVSDHGIGIPYDEQKKIFQQFYRASNAKLVKTDGTGLGLYMAAVIAGKLRAHITFESEEKKGSTFSLHVPKQ